MDTLPNEILLEIFKYVPIKTLYNIQQLSKSFDKLIRSDSILWPTIPLNNILYNIIGFDSASNKELYEIISKVYLLQWCSIIGSFCQLIPVNKFNDIKCTFKKDVVNPVQLFNQELSNMIRGDKEFTDIMDIECTKNEIIWQQDHYGKDIIKLFFR